MCPPGPGREIPQRRHARQNGVGGSRFASVVEVVAHSRACATWKTGRFAPSDAAWRALATRPAALAQIHFKHRFIIPELGHRYDTKGSGLDRPEPGVMEGDALRNSAIWRHFAPSSTAMASDRPRTTDNEQLTTDNGQPTTDNSPSNRIRPIKRDR
jgi:hypothetical protein